MASSSKQDDGVGVGAYAKYYYYTDDDKYVKCTICNNPVYRGAIGHRTASNMGLHIRTNHKKEAQEVKDLIEKKKNEKPSNSIQPTIEEGFQQNKKWDINDPRSLEIHDAIAVMMAMDYEPFNLVNRLGFRRLMELIAPKYDIPSRPYFADTVLPKIYSKVKKLVQVLIGAQPCLSFTTDTWTASNNNYSFISLTAHWVNPSTFLKEEILLSMKYLTDRHTGEYLGLELTEELKKWNMTNKVHAVIRDNGPDIVKAMRCANLPTGPCILHILNNVIKYSIKSQVGVNNMVKKAKRIVGHFGHSSGATLSFQKILTQLNEKPAKLLQDIDTRWNYKYYLLKRLYKTRNAVSLYIMRETPRDVHDLTTQEWELIPPLIGLLHHFEELTLLFSSKQSLISDVIPMIKMLISALEKESPVHRGVGTIKNTMIRELTTRCADIFQDEKYALPTLIDPRYKDIFFSEEETTKWINSLVKAILAKDEYVQGSSSTTLPPPPPMEGPLNIIEATHNSLLDEHSTFAAKKRRMWSDDTEPESTEEQRMKIVEEEVARFMIAKGQQLKFKNVETGKHDRNNPFVWWKKEFVKFPSIATVLFKYFSAPPSSVESERTFSEAGQVCEDQRSRLSPDYIELLVFLHHNLPKFNFKL